MRTCSSRHLSVCGRRSSNWVEATCPQSTRRSSAQKATGNSCYTHDSPERIVLHMPSAAIISKPNRPELKELVSGIVDWLERHGYQVVLDLDSSSHVSGCKCASREQLHNYKLDFAVVLGGDGTLLAAASGMANSKGPLLTL